MRDQEAALRFVDRVSPSGGIRYLVVRRWRKNDHGFRITNHPFVNNQELLEIIDPARYGNDLHVTIASFKQRKVNHAGTGRLVSFRKRANIDLMGALMLDIDVKNDDYSAVASSVEKLISAGMPDPTYITATGGGVHILWGFSDPCTLSEWSVMSSALLNLCKKHGIHHDPTPTKIPVSTVRLPGALNQKYDPPRRVSILTEGDTYSVSSLRDVLDDYAVNGHMIVDREGISALFSEDNLDAGIERPKTNMSIVVRKCPALEAVAARGGAGDSYVAWRNTLNLLAFASDGEEWVEALAGQHAEYDHTESMGMLLDAKRNSPGPTSCDSFSETFSECRTCPHRGKIKSPWALGIEEKKELLPTWVTDKGTWTKIVVTSKGEHGAESEEKSVLMTEARLTNWRIRVAIDNDGMEMLSIDYQIGSRKGTIEEEPGLFTDARKLKMVFANKYFAIPAPLVQIFQNAAMSWINHLRKQTKDFATPKGMGWTTDGNFVIGKTLVTKTGTSDVVTADPVITRDYSEVGSIDPWLELAKLQADDEYDGFSFLLAAGFAAPLMPMSFPMSLVVSAQSAKSGVGKTTMMRLIQAAWGDPSKTFTLDDTANYIIQRTALANNIPSIWDEVRGHDAAKTIAATLFRMSQGKSKGRMASNIAIRDTYKINTVMLCGTNTPLSDYMLIDLKSSDAGARRFLEFNMDGMSRSVSTKIDGLTALVAENYGHAGRIFVGHLVKNRKAVMARLEYVAKELTSRMNPGQAERFWFYGLVKITVAAHLLRETQLVPNLRVDRVLRFGAAIIEENSDVTRQVSRATADIVQHMVATLSDHVLFTDTFFERGADRRPVVEREPRRNVLVHYARKEGKIRLSHNAIMAYASDSGLSYRNIVSSIRDEYGGIVKHATLGGGTRFALGSERVCEFTADMIMKEKFSASSGKTPSGDSASS